MSAINTQADATLIAILAAYSEHGAEKALGLSRMILAKHVADECRGFLQVCDADTRLEVAHELDATAATLSRPVAAAALTAFAVRLRRDLAASGVTVHECGGGNDGAPR